MANSPASRRNLYTNNKDIPGCMGGLMHLFDFNQALAGRKLLTDRKSGAVGLEAPRNSLDVGGSIPEVPKPRVDKNEESPYGYELPKASAPRKSNGMPIKALIAQELSKESDSKNRSPSVVARLMGLEALPTDSKAVQKPSSASILGKIDEKFTQRSVVERPRHEEVAPHSIRLYAKKAKASAGSTQITPKSTHSQRSESPDRKPATDSVVLRNHPQEQQLQEFKKEFEAWQSQKSWAHSKRSSRLDDTQVRMPSQQGLPRERQMDGKPALPRESAPSQKMIAPEDRLHESREFQDALDFLQSNKEFFMRFLHEPNSLFARHLQERESDNVSPLEVTKGTKHRRSQQQAPDASESPRPPSWAMESSMSRPFERVDGREESRPLSWHQDSPIQRSPGGPLMTEKGKPNMPPSPLVNNEESLGLRDQRSRAFSPMASQNRSQNADSHIPTRIVVLKPSPGRVRNLKSTSPVYFRSPKDHIASDAFREENTDVLERLREKLRKDNGGDYNRSERRSGVLHLNEHYRDASKDPREIAREIARQVRENITRDLMADPRYSSNVQSTARKKSPGSRPSQVGDSKDNIYSDGEPHELTNRAYWDRYARSSRGFLQTDKSFDSEAMRGSIDEKAHIIEQVKRRVSDGSVLQGNDLRIKNNFFDKESRNRDHHHHLPVRLKTSLNPKGSGKFTVDGSILNQPHTGSLYNDYTHQVQDSLSSDPALGLDAPSQQSKADFSGSMHSVEPEEAENVTDCQIHEGAAKVRSESEVFDSIDLATSDILLTNVDGSGNFAVAEVKQTTEENDKLQPTREEEADVYKEEKQEVAGGQSVFNHEVSASLCNELCDPSQASVNAEDCTNIDNLQDTDAKLELKGEPKSQEFDYPDSLETPGNVQMSEISNNDLHSQVDSTPAPTSSVLLSSCESNLSMEPGKEQPEQPSPVSVLDLPFQDDASVATEFKELSSDLEELRMRLRLLNFENGNHDLDDDDDFDSELDAGKHPAEACNVEEDVIEDMHTNEDVSLSDTCFKVADGTGEDSDMCYVRDVLSASGFLGDSSSVLTQWYAPGQPLNPRLFQSFEKRFSTEDDIKGIDQAASKLHIQKGDFNSSRRCLLFDFANEVLVDVLGPYLNRRIWLSSKFAPPMPTGKDLIELVWKQILCSLCSHSGSQETLENLVTKDLGKGSGWLDIVVEIEAAGFDVEKAILDDLIEETLLVL